MELVEKCSREILKYDEACVTLTNQASIHELWLYALTSDCHECPYTRRANFTKSESTYLRVNTADTQFWRVETRGHEKYISASIKSGEQHCQLTPAIGQYGIYELVAAPDRCDFLTHREPTNPYTPLAIAIGLTISLLCCLSIASSIRSRMSSTCMRKKSERNDEEAAANSRAKQRVRCLDAVRGASILLMIFSNNSAGGYKGLWHATWTGLYLADLVFPTFMWIMGVCIPLSISSLLLSRGTPRRTVCWAIVKRSVYLFLIGIMLNSVGNANLEKLRIPGVLQRFSIAYLAVGLAYTLTIRKSDELPKSTRPGWLADISALLAQWLIALSILITHTAIVFYLPVPHCPRGYLGPGGIHADGKYSNCTGGATGYLDKILLGERHIYQHAVVTEIYESQPFDPENFLGCLTTIFHTFLGVQAGQTLLMFKGWRDRVSRWMLWALVLGSIGLALHYSDYVPINKHLWSLSFVLVSTCFSLCLLTLFYLLIDVIGIWQGGPFRIPGMNALVMYMGHQLFATMLPFSWTVDAIDTHGWMLAKALWTVGAWAGLAYALHWKKLYFRL